MVSVSLSVLSQSGFYLTTPGDLTWLDTGPLSDKDLLSSFDLGPYPQTLWVNCGGLQ